MANYLLFLFFVSHHQWTKSSTTCQSKTAGGGDDKEKIKDKAFGGSHLSLLFLFSHSPGRKFLYSIPLL
jgi:hypothetical protein